MKAFKKWFNASNRFDVHGCEAGWRAALECMKEKLEHEILPGDLEYFIDKELED